MLGEIGSDFRSQTIGEVEQLAQEGRRPVGGDADSGTGSRVEARGMPGAALPDDETSGRDLGMDRGIASCRVGVAARTVASRNPGRVAPFTTVKSVMANMTLQTTGGLTGPDAGTGSPQRWRLRVMSEGRG